MGMVVVDTWRTWRSGSPRWGRGVTWREGKCLVTKHSVLGRQLLSGGGMMQLKEG